MLKRIQEKKELRESSKKTTKMFNSQKQVQNKLHKLISLTKISKPMLTRKLVKMNAVQKEKNQIKKNF